MDSQLTEEIEDIAAALHAGRKVRHHGPYRILIGNGSLSFEPHTIYDPIPTGSQILDAAGIIDPVNFVAYRILHNGLLEALRLDETTDLRDSGAERFIIFRTDRSFRFLLNDRSFDWGAPHITGLTLKKLAGVDPVSTAVVQEVPGALGRTIADLDFVDLAAPGVERFATRTQEYDILVNTRPKHVVGATVTFWAVVMLAFPQAAQNATTYHTVTFKRGPKPNPEGSMVAGDSVYLKEGMLFNVTSTDKS